MDFPSAHAPALGVSVLWTRFRSWPWWGQALLWLIGPLALVGTTLWIAAGIWSIVDGGHEKVATAAPVGPTPTSEHGTAERKSAALSASPVDAPPAVGIDRSLSTDTLLTTLASITVEPEHARSGYDRALFPHWDDTDHDGCDTRCEVLSAQRHADGTWLSEWDGYITSDSSELDVDHVVALAEAWDSGADQWTGPQRDEFADYLPNLLAVTAAENTRKSDRDASEWFPARSEANCLWSSTVVRVKAHWSLTVDQAEHDALVNLLHTCADYVAPATTAPPPPATTLPPLVAPPTTQAAPVNDCTPGYDPCIAPGSDVDCAGGSGNGPRYVSGPVYVSGNDPYGLDSDHDGVGCE